MEDGAEMGLTAFGPLLGHELLLVANLVDVGTAVIEGIGDSSAFVLDVFPHGQFLAVLADLAVPIWTSSLIPS